ncbi:MAG: hypothetical protein Q7R40_10450 [Phaeospirillum sp.]|nr:hypothetical protein [Phaeospirillum sp.]
MHYEDSLAPDLEQPTPAATRPANVPAKFWDAAKRQIRTDALLRAYLDLERRSSALIKPPGIPDRAELYQITHKHPDLASSPDVNHRLHKAGFTQQQAQLVYDLAHDCLLPLLADMTGKNGEAADLSHLQQHFGGETRWRQIAPQLAAWGKKNLPVEAYDVLVASPEGVKTLHRLMGSGEPSLGRVPTAKDEGSSEEQLKKMLQDPRYWKTRDPAFIAKVTSGFRRLYGEE